MSRDHPPKPVLLCGIGDVVEFKASSTVDLWPGEEGPSHFVEAGARYRTVKLIGYGWDLKRVSGVGPDEIRIINSQIPQYVTVVEQFSAFPDDLSDPLQPLVDDWKDPSAFKARVDGLSGDDVQSALQQAIDELMVAWARAAHAEKASAAENLEGPASA